VRKSNLARRASTSAHGAALLELGFAFHPSRIATRLTEIRRAARIKCRIMTLERGRRINFSQNARAQSPQIKSTPALQPCGRRRTQRPASRPRPYRRCPAFRADGTNNKMTAKPADAATTIRVNVGLQLIS
jgi:hypothetical protein